MARGEVPERHPVMSADLGIQLMDGADKPVGRKPARYRVRFEECAIELVGPSGDDAVQTDRAGMDCSLSDGALRASAMNQTVKIIPGKLVDVVPLLFLVSLISFFLTALIPGDAARAALGEYATAE